jgi:hypothetical protein
MSFFLHKDCGQVPVVNGEEKKASPPSYTLGDVGLPACQLPTGSSQSFTVPTDEIVAQDYDLSSPTHAAPVPGRACCPSRTTDRTRGGLVGDRVGVIATARRLRDPTDHEDGGH